MKKGYKKIIEQVAERIPSLRREIMSLREEISALEKTIRLSREILPEPEHYKFLSFFPGSKGMSELDLAKAVVEELTDETIGSPWWKAACERTLKERKSDLDLAEHKKLDAVPSGRSWWDAYCKRLNKEEEKS